MLGGRPVEAQRPVPSLHLMISPYTLHETGMGTTNHRLGGKPHPESIDGAVEVPDAWSSGPYAKSLLSAFPRLL
jgi:hypothetical protein